MGNRILCADAGFRCTENCKRISRDDNVLNEQFFGGCDPAGAVFDETLEGLNELDRQLILFSSSTNVIAVRWLLEMGASQEACDTNNTSCLHAACRSGSLAVVQSLLNVRCNVDSIIVSARGSLPVLGAIDSSGWTPLHIAVFMGRPEITASLLASKARIDRRNHAEQTPLDLCNDSRTRMILMSPEKMQFEALAPVQFGGGLIHAGDGDIRNEVDLGEDFAHRNGIEQSPAATPPPPTRNLGPSSAMVQQREMRFEPFFVPRAPVIQGGARDEEVTKQLTALGEAIFNRQPGRGLAFLVASGCTRDYPIDLVAMLRGNNFDLAQIGTFLGEDFSLSKILRMEFINSISLVNSGVGQTLDKAFSNFKPPMELRKLDRILAGLSEVWWRQHDRKPLAAQNLPVKVEEPCGTGDSDDVDWAVPMSGLEAMEETQSSPAQRRENTLEQFQRLEEEEVLDEMEGMALRRWLPGPDALHQLLFSAVLVHSNLHEEEEHKRVSRNRWLEINDCFTDIPTAGYDRVLKPIYQGIKKAPLPSMKDWFPSGQIKPQLNAKSAVADLAQVEGWSRILGEAMPLLNQRAGVGGAAVTGIWQMFSEATASSRRHQPDGASSMARLMRDELTARSSRGVNQHPAFGGQVLPADTPQGAASAATSGQGSDSATVQHFRPPAPDVVWLSLCENILFFSVDPAEGSPFAFIHLGRVQFAGIEPAHSTIALDGGPDPIPSAAGVASENSDNGKKTKGASKGSRKAGTVDASRKRLPLWLVFLLPDGRWQSFELPQLVLEICDKAQLEGWVLKLSELSVNIRESTFV